MNGPAAVGWTGRSGVWAASRAPRCGHFAAGADEQIRHVEERRPLVEIRVVEADKIPIYAREQVTYVWLIDPLVRTLEVFRLDGETYRALAVWRDDAVVRAEPFDAIAIELAGLWAD